MNYSSLVVSLCFLLIIPLQSRFDRIESPTRGLNGFTDTAAGSDSLSVSTTWPWSKRIAESFLLRHPGSVTYDTGSPNQRWNYEQGLMLEAFHQMWLVSRDHRYYDFIKGNIDQFVGDSGSIRTYKYDDFNLDNVAVGRALLTLYQETGSAKYMRAADTLRRQLQNQPRTHEGGFWHKQIYPFQMWLDGLFMAEPFYAWYSVVAKDQKAFDDIANQFAYIEHHTRDPKTGLLYHGWDESKQQRWANQQTGCSPNFWGRALGWYEMALVDVLDFLPANHPRRAQLVKILRDVSASVLQFQDKKTHLWYQVMDQGGREGNYPEASASSMFVYAFAKGANKHYLEKKYFTAATEAFHGITASLVTIEASGFVDLHETCQGAGLGGKPYRDGSYEYYVSEPRRINDMKGYGAFLLAAIELEKGGGVVGKQ